MPDSFPIDPVVVARMGYDDMVAAVSYDHGSQLIEIGIVAPAPDGSGPYGDRFAVIAHFDCDPDQPTNGVSSLSDHSTLDEAADAFRELVAEHSPPALKA